MKIWMNWKRVRYVPKSRLLVITSNRLSYAYTLLSHFSSLTTTSLTALEQFAVKEERQAVKQAKEVKQEAKRREQEKRRRSTGALLTGGQNSNKSTRSIGSTGQLLPSFGGNGESDHSRRGLGMKNDPPSSSIPTASDGTSGSRASRRRHATTTRHEKNARDERRNNRRSGLKKQNSNKSCGSNKSLPFSALAEKVPEPNSHPGHSSSNRSLATLCAPKDQLQTIFQNSTTAASMARGGTFDWKSYYSTTTQSKDTEIPPQLERAIKSKRENKLRQFVETHGMSMLKARNDLGESVAHLVCRHGSPEQLAFLLTECAPAFTVRVQDLAGKTPLHELAWAPTFQPGMAMMIMSDSPELLFAQDQRGFLALDYVPRRAQMDWYDFLELKQACLRLALQFSRFKASSMALNQNQERLKHILEQRLAKQ